MLAVFPSNTRDLIEQMIEMDGRMVDYYTVTYSGCPACSLDPISNTSTDSLCLVCSGLYWIPTYTASGILSHVTWGKSEDKDWATGGMVDNGDCTVKFMHSAEREDFISEVQYVVVDDRTMNIVDIALRGIPEVNRVIVKLKEKEK